MSQSSLTRYEANATGATSPEWPDRQERPPSPQPPQQRRLQPDPRQPPSLVHNFHDCSVEMSASRARQRPVRSRTTERLIEKNVRVWQPSSVLLRKEFLNIMFITAAVFTVTGAVVAVRSAFGAEPEDAWALPLEEDLQASRKRLYCFFNHSAHRRPEPVRFGVDSIRVELCDDIVYCYLGVDPATANIVSKDPKFDIQQEGLRKFTRLRDKDVSLVIWAAVGGRRSDGEAFRKLAVQRRYRVEFSENAARWLLQYGFDGLVLHWPNLMGEQDRQALGTFLRTLRRRLSADGQRLAVVVPADKAERNAGFDVQDIINLVDVMFVETHRTMEPATFPVTSFYSPLRVKTQAKRRGQTGLSHVLGDMSLELTQMDKVVFGVTLAGASFTLKNVAANKAGDPSAGPGKPGLFTRQPGTLSHYELEQMLAHDLSWSRQFDRVAQCSYVVNGDQWVGFEDDVSLQSKAHLLLFTGGIAVWDICMDDFRGTFGRPLLARARDILLRNHTFGHSLRAKGRLG
ncbi:chitinase-3-like protein 1 isoform X1 [Dermacentor variabilis]|uniref:chitinase-3-like protein 1 isoform X1 n=1 Tax=Dermacentor variabilis TaxID=34621 RepID=UPI003F5B5F50